jgi:hypothetical protein
MSETGHAKNAANFEILTNVVTTLGSAYNPTNDELKLPNLITVLSDAKSSLASIQEVFSQWKDMTNQREIAFDSVEKLSTRAVSSFAVSGADELDVTDAKSFVCKASVPRQNPNRKLRAKQSKHIPPRKQVLTIKPNISPKSSVF